MLKVIYIVASGDESDIYVDEELLKDEDDTMAIAEPGQEGISVWDLLGESFLQEVSWIGMFSVVFPTPKLMFCLDGTLVDEDDLTLLQAYSLRVDDGITEKTFNKFRFVFPQAPIDSLKTLKNVSNSSPAFSLYDTIAVSLHVYATLARMKHFCNVQSANRIATRPMERHHSHILNIFPSSLAFAQCFLIIYMHGKCNTGQITNEIQQS